jgi:hypothetical protein
MPDCSFHPCARTEHSELLNKLLYGDYSKYRQLSSVQKIPDGGACLWDTDFKFISFEGDITPEVREFVESNLNNFSKEQLKLIKTKFMFQFGKKSDEFRKISEKIERLL